MYTLTSTVPVTVEVSVSEVVAGIIEINGLLSCDEKNIFFEYQTKNIRQQQSEVTQLDFRIDDFREITYRGGTKIYLSPKRLVTVEPMPGAQRNELVFKVKRRHRKQAANLVTHLRHLLFMEQTSDSLSIPFRLPSANLGLTEIRGLLFLEDSFLVFEVETGLPGGTERDRQKIKVEPAALEEIRFDRGTIRDRLIIRPKKHDLLSAMPGKYKEEIKCSIRKKYRDSAEHLVYVLQSLGKKTRVK